MSFFNKNDASRRHFLRAATLFPALLPQLSAEERVNRPKAAAEIWARTELYFGTNKLRCRSERSEFATFVDLEVTKRFPDGLTC